MWTGWEQWHSHGVWVPNPLHRQKKKEKDKKRKKKRKRKKLIILCNRCNTMHQIVYLAQVFQHFSGVTPPDPFLCCDPDRAPLPFNILAARLAEICWGFQTASVMTLVNMRVECLRGSWSVVDRLRVLSIVWDSRTFWSARLDRLGSSQGGNLNRPNND